MKKKGVLAFMMALVGILAFNIAHAQQPVCPSLADSNTLNRYNPENFIKLWEITTKIQKMTDREVVPDKRAIYPINGNQKYENPKLIDNHESILIEIDKEYLMNCKVKGSISMNAFVKGKKVNRAIPVENYTSLSEESTEIKTTPLGASMIEDKDEEIIKAIYDNIDEVDKILAEIETKVNLAPADMSPGDRNQIVGSLHKIDSLIVRNIHLAWALSPYDAGTVDLSYIALLYDNQEFAEYAKLFLTPQLQQIMKEKGQEILDEEAFTQFVKSLKYTKQKLTLREALDLRLRHAYVIWLKVIKWKDTPNIYSMDKDPFKKQLKEEVIPLRSHYEPDLILEYIQPIRYMETIYKIKNGQVNLIDKKLEHGDRLIVTVNNQVDAKTTISKSWYFIVTEFGWSSSVESSLIFVKPNNYCKKIEGENGEETELEMDKSWKPAPGGSLLFRYRSPRNEFWTDMLTPGFGINLSLLDFDPENMTEIGVAPVMSWLDNNLVVGYGFNLSVPENPSYWFIGFNFLHSIDTFESFTQYYANVQAGTSGTESTKQKPER